MISEAARRSVFRWVHLVFGIPIIGYIYSPFEDLRYYARSVRFFFVPVLVLSGLWLWKGHVVRRLLGRPRHINLNVPHQAR